MAERTHMILLMPFVTFQHTGMGVDLVSEIIPADESNEWEISIVSS